MSAEMKLTPEQVDAMRKAFPAKWSAPILEQIQFELSARLLQSATIADVFGGVGGIHDLAHVMPVTTWAVDIEPEFAACHPRTVLGDSRDLPGVMKRHNLPKPDAVICSPAYGNRLCLAAGTMVITWEGPTPIEHVQPGALVLTHRGRWRPVTWAGSKGVKPVVRVEGQGAGSLTCTPDHPIWSAQRGDTGIREIGWRPAAALGNRPDIAAQSWYRFHYWSTPAEIEPTDLPPCPRGADVWWFVGFWLGNGSVGHNSTTGHPSTVMVSKDLRWVDLVEPRLQAVGAKRRPDVARLATWNLHDSTFAVWLKAVFGRSAYTKTVPGWTLGLEAEERSAFLDGWLAADGHDRPDRASNIGVSISAGLIRGMQMIAASVHRSCGYGSREAYRGEIMGTVTDFAESHRLDVHDGISRKAHLADGAIWYAVRSIAPAGEVEVFDLEVEDDHSFVANGIAVHNSDQYLGSENEKCRDCMGTGHIRSGDPDGHPGVSSRTCERCGGTGKAKSTRKGYAIALGRLVSKGSGAGLAWGPEYRRLHGEVLDSMVDVDAEWWMINVSSFLKTIPGNKRPQYQPVMEWWVEQIARRYRVQAIRAIQTGRMGHGENQKSKVPVEHLIIARRP